MNSDEIRLNKYLSEAGFCSRREADRLIEAGEIFVDNQIAVMGQKVLPGQVVSCGKLIIGHNEKPVILAFNKPAGVECTSAHDVENNIIDYINYPCRIFPIGRLDKNSTGLILLTNIGELSDKILRGSNFHEKEYLVKVDHKITDDFIQKMSKGVKISLEDGKREVTTRPCKVSKISDDEFKIILTQGLNRQIRRMCKSLGCNVISLHRVRIMNILLGNLKEGSYRELTASEIKTIKAQLYPGQD